MTDQKNNSNVLPFSPRACREMEPWLAVWAADGLADADKARVQAHVASCERCAAELAEIRAVLTHLQADIAPPRPASYWQGLASDIARATDGTPQQPHQPTWRAWRVHALVATGLAAAAAVALTVMPKQRAEEAAPVAGAELEWLQVPTLPVLQVDEDLVNDNDPLETLDDLDDDELELVDSVLGEGGV